MTEIHFTTSGRVDKRPGARAPGTRRPPDANAEHLVERAEQSPPPPPMLGELTGTKLQSSPRIGGWGVNSTILNTLAALAFCASLLCASGSTVLAESAKAVSSRSHKATAKTPAAVPAASVWRPLLGPRHVALPPADPKAGIVNPVDRLLSPYYVAHKVPPALPVDDRAFARRVTLDLIGTLPPERELREFVADKAPDKRRQLVIRLLKDDARYAEHWLSFWNDMLRNDYIGTGYIDGGRAQITDWLYAALETNMPYNRFVAELVDPKPESAGFTKGIVWRGVVNASQTPEMQAAQNISQVFLGINLKCASCHNSFISSWKLADAYGMAGIYVGKPLEMVRCDKPTGQTAPVKFLFPELGGIDSSAPAPMQRAQLAALLTNPADGRLSRVLVNRIWTKLMGRGLVEPNDDMDRKPWNPDLLDWLADDFARNGYNVRRLMLQITTSQAYQRPVMALKSERVTNFVFAGPAVKRMSAEQYADAVSTLTGYWRQPARQVRIVNGEPRLASNARGVVQFKSPVMKSGSVDIDFDCTGAQVLMLLANDGGDGNSFDWVDWAEARVLTPSGEVKLSSLKPRAASTGFGQVETNRNVTKKPIRLGDRTFTNGIGVHANSVLTYDLPAGVTRFRATAGPDTGAIEQTGSKTSVQLCVVTGDLSLLQGRASLSTSDALMRAMDRPNREQVVTQRATVATTLQALELTNGQTLANMLSQGAERWSHTARTPDNLVSELYQQALGRLPSAAEKQAALSVIGTPVNKEGMEDFLWALVMLPEFQLIY